jgi:hypothetical protein
LDRGRAGRRSEVIRQEAKQANQTLGMTLCAAPPIVEGGGHRGLLDAGEMEYAAESAAVRP